MALRDLCVVFHHGPDRSAIRPKLACSVGYDLRSGIGHHHRTGDAAESRTGAMVIQERGNDDVQ